MKKFLLVLSCCLATWCSVQAGPKSSPEISLMQACAPAVAPAPTQYPAVLSSAAYDKNNCKQVNVSFTANQSGYVSFDLQGVQIAEDLGVTPVSSGSSYNISFPVPDSWNSHVNSSIIIKFSKSSSVKGSGCGGMLLPGVPDTVPPHPGNVQGYIEPVELVGCDKTEDGWPQYIRFNYNLTNAPNNPYLFINEEGGKNITKIRIYNTNDYCYTTSYSGHRNTMKENTTYVAYLGIIDAQGKESYLGIQRSFVMPPKKHYTYDFSCRWEPSMNQFHIYLNPNYSPLVNNVQIWVEPINGGTYQYTYSGAPKKDYYFGIPSSYKGKYYVVRVRWSNGVVKTQTILR